MVKRALLIALLSGMLAYAAAARAQPPEAETALNNDSVRVTLLTFRPGAATGRHQGLEPELGIVLEGELTVESPKGLEVVKAGGLYWLPGLTPHDVRNEGPRPAKLWDILLKRCE